jgi:hypothetical protein
MKVYGNIKQQRLRMILSALELHLRTSLHEKVSLPERLDIEHIMPQGWRAHWGKDVRDDPVLSADRDLLVNTLGNLTLASRRLNSTLSHRPWLDEDAQKLLTTGKYAGWGKRRLLFEFSLLALTKEFVAVGQEEWAEQNIRDRSRRLTEAIVEVWPKPAGKAVAPQKEG